MANLFRGATHAKLYMQFRPHYPNKVYDVIVEYCEKHCANLVRAIDVGCGSGQSTLPLTNFFEQIVGIDPSESQIAEAKSLNPDPHKIEYRVGLGEELKFQENETVDLITVAQTFHWVDPDRFYREAGRVLRPGGVVAIYGYGNMSLENPSSNQIITKFYRETLWANGFWDSRRRHIDNHYVDFAPMPLHDFCRNDSVVLKNRLSINHMMGYLSTWSGYRAYLKAFPESTVLADIKSQLLSIHGGEECEVLASWPVFILLAHK